MRSVWHLGGICSEERRGYGYLLAADHGHIQGEVVTIDLPSPRLSAPRRAEHAEVVQPLQAVESERAVTRLQLPKYRLVADDRVGLPHSLGAEADGHQGLGGVQLRERHLAARKAGPRTRDIMPVLPLVVVEREHRPLPQVRVLEIAEKRLRSLGDPVYGRSNVRHGDGTQILARVGSR